MKIIVTEDTYQFLKDYALLEEIVNENILNEGLNLKELFKRYKKAMAIGIAVSSIIFSINHLNLNDRDKERLKLQLGIEMQDNKTDSLMQQKIDAVREYMVTALKNRNVSEDNLKLSPEKIVQACENNNFDIPLLLAQAHLESCFGITNRAQKTNSVWSVGSYDNGKNVCTYASQDDSIVPYIKLMNNNYLNGKSVDDILTPGQFIDKNGNRYAQDPKYETKVKSIRNKILQKYPELG